MPSGVTRARELKLALATALAVLWAPLLTLLREGPRGLVHYLAGDTLYYVTVATRSQGAPFFTFDGELPTNGFHPLWQLLLTALFAIVEPGPEAQIGLAIGIGALLTALGTALFAVALLHVGGRPVLAFLASVPGAYWLLWARPHPELLSPWAYINGMETPLSIAFFGALAWFALARDGLRQPTPARLLLASALLAGALLARLDDVFLVGLFVLWMLVRSPERRFERTALLALVPTLALGSWLIYSQLTVGTWMPLSGAAKASGFVSGFLRNGYAVLTTFLPIVDIRPSGLRLWEGEAMRVVQMGVPALAALAFLALARPFGALGQWAGPSDALRARAGNAFAATDPEARRDYQREIGGVLACYVLVKVGYNFGWVGLYHQGHWYFPIAFFAVDLFAVWSAAPTLDRLGVGRDGWLRWAAPLAAALLVAFSAGVHSARKAAAQPLAIALRVWDQRVDLQRELDARCPACGIVSFDDATLAFALSNRIANGLGLAADLELSKAMKRGELLQASWQRGLRLLATASYPFGVRAGDDPAAVRAALGAYTNLRGQSLDGWRFELLFIHEPTGATFVRFSPSEPADF